MKSPTLRRVIGVAALGSILAWSVASIAQPQPMPPGHPMPGGFPHGPGARPLGPPGMPPLPPTSPHPKPHHRGGGSQSEPAEEGHAHAEHCPGHGPMEPPPPINLWHGLLGVNNEAAQSGSPLKQLLFRYEDPQNPCDPKNEPPPFLAQLINFAILAFVIGKFGQKPVAAALVKRKETIMQEIDNATRLREQAETRLLEYQEKFENIEERLDAAKAEYAAQSDQEKQRILLEVEERRTRMRRDAEFRIEQELKEAKLALIREAVDGAVLAAEQLIKSRVASSDQDRLAEEYLAAIGKAASPSKGATAPGGRA